MNVDLIFRNRWVFSVDVFLSMASSFCALSGWINTPSGGADLIRKIPEAFNEALNVIFYWYFISIIVFETYMRYYLFYFYEVSHVCHFGLGSLSGRSNGVVLLVRNAEVPVLDIRWEGIYHDLFWQLRFYDWGAYFSYPIFLATETIRPRRIW